MNRQPLTVLTCALLTFAPAAALAEDEPTTFEPAIWDLECSLGTVSLRVDGLAPDIYGALSPFAADIEVTVGCLSGLTTSMQNNVVTRVYDACVAVGAESFSCTDVAMDAGTLAAQFEEQLVPAIPRATRLTPLRRATLGPHAVLTVWADHTLADGTVEQWMYAFRRNTDFISGSPTYVEDTAGLRMSCLSDSSMSLAGDYDFRAGTMVATQTVTRALSCDLEETHVDLEVRFDVDLEGYRR